LQRVNAIATQNAPEPRFSIHGFFWVNLRKCFNKTTLNRCFFSSVTVNQTRLIEEATMGDTFNAGQVGAMGPGARANNMVFNQLWIDAQAQIDLPTLANQLAMLRAAVKTDPSSPGGDDADEAVGALLSAEKAAKSGNGPKTLQMLSGVGNWVLGIASKIGVGVVEKAIQEALGIG